MQAYGMRLVSKNSEESELEAAKLEIHNWHSSFQNEHFIPPGASLEPKLVINYLQTIRFSEEILKEQNLVEEKDKKVKELEENIAAVAFTANSKMRKALMSKCKTLQEENEEIGRQNEEGETHQLQLKLALQKFQNAVLRSQFEGLYKHMEGLTDNVDRSNEMVEEKDCEIERLKHELDQKSLLEEEEKTDSVLDTC
ncbi:hypothetical protein Q3G72_020860 [Acer saccharum]|nr:hypothetical protein Q3G72_020860 [Acer saccharum]